MSLGKATNNELNNKKIQMNSKRLNLYSIFLLLLMFLFTKAYGQNGEVRFPKESLKSRVQQIAKKSGKNIIFDGELLEKIEVPPLAVPNADMKEALRKSLEATGFTMKTMPDGSIAIRKGETPKEEKTNERGRLSGRVTDDKGEPIAGATVMVAGTTKATFTDADGRYALSLGAGTVTLEVTFLAYQKKTIT
ncbi:MAG: pfeA 1, partial [Bacteroidetes bacterium]|nr:pfeA 1 [Bacteroidota bacterium]